MEDEMKRPEVKTVSAVEEGGGWEGQLGVEDEEDEGMKEKESELRAGGMWVEDTPEICPLAVCLSSSHGAPQSLTVL
ncbi:hypothetical protein QQF64_030892 [Cirrhinus molitorella]|uniref:Uncharacterized protein n=1 Tax=Cirrhinus molitorella TaxID=172907 RepID=A0ABR3N4W1_9TELE